MGAKIKSIFANYSSSFDFVYNFLDDWRLVLFILCFFAVEFC